MTPNAAFPTPDQRPHAPIVIYDGQCRICTSGVRSLTLFDWLGKLAYLSLHDPRVEQEFPDLTYEQMMSQMYVVNRQGLRLGAAAALRYALLRLPLGWPLGVLMHLPGTLPLWNWLYHQIAERRYRFGRLEDCEGGTCSIHAHKRG